MQKRRKLGKHHSRRMFTKHGSKTHKRNLLPRRLPMRGGIRL